MFNIRKVFCVNVKCWYQIVDISTSASLPLDGSNDPDEYPDLQNHAAATTSIQAL